MHSRVPCMCIIQTVAPKPEKIIVVIVSYYHTVISCVPVRSLCFKEPVKKNTVLKAAKTDSNDPLQGNCFQHSNKLRVAHERLPGSVGSHVSIC